MAYYGHGSQHLDRVPAWLWEVGWGTWLPTPTQTKLSKMIRLKQLQLWGRLQEQKKYRPWSSSAGLSEKAENDRLVYHWVKSSLQMPKKNITPATLLLVCYSLVVQCSRYRAHGGKVWSHLPCNAPVMISIYPPRFSSMQCMQRGVESNAWAGSSDVLVGRVGANQTLDIASSANHSKICICICVFVL